ncbi:hypothetical protein OROGR_022189 [Orobanche gracilis]
MGNENSIVKIRLLFLAWFHLRSRPGPPPSLVKRFSYKDIKKATGGFKKVIDNSNSSQGASYKAKFRNGRVATIKEVKLSDEDDDSFYRKVQILGRLHHRHIVGLCGFFDGSKRFLVFENTGIGSLKEHLSDPLRTPLNWRIRLQIAIGVAAAVISDICLFSAAENPAFLPASSRCLEVCTGEGCKTMIFQLGLVILELVTGQSTGNDDVDLIQWVRESNFSRSIHMIDPDLGNNYDPRELNGLLNVARLCIKSVNKPRIYTHQILWYLQKKIGTTPRR